MAYCTSCMNTFLSNPVNLGIIMGSLALSIVSLLFVKNRIKTNEKLALVYAHIFFFVFPVIYYFFFRGCTMYFSMCHRIKAITVMVIFTMAVAVLLALLVAPFLFFHNQKKKSRLLKENYIAMFIKDSSDKFSIKTPQVYLLDIAKPVAYSFNLFKAKIFVSVGIVELLSMKELEAVLLHEIGHIKNNSSLFKFSTFFVRALSPIAMFTSFRADLNSEERKADKFVVKCQKTGRYLKKAKIKVEEYWS